MSNIANYLWYLWAGLTLISFPIGLSFFMLGWYHGWRMFSNRSGHWTGYYAPFGFLLDKSLNKEGIYHRSKMLKHLTIATPFMIVLLTNAMLVAR